MARISPDRALQILSDGGYHDQRGVWRWLTERQRRYFESMAHVRGRARSAPNPLLTVVGLGMGNPRGRRTRKNPTDKTKKMDRHFSGMVTIDSAREYAASIGKLAEFDQGFADYVQFHGVEPTEIALYEVPDKSKEIRDDFGAALGRVPRTVYRASGNGGSKDAAEKWLHDHPRGAEPLEVKLASTGLPIKVGGSFKIDDWWRD